MNTVSPTPLPDQSAATCQVPDSIVTFWGWIVACASGLAVAGKWIVSETSEGCGATALGLIFALNAGFASINAFTKGFLFSLRRDFCKLTAKYRDPKWLDSIPVSKDEGSSSLNHREQLADLANNVLEMENNMTAAVRKTARTWKIAMGLCAAITLGCLFIPYYGRILILLALPVPLFALRCHFLRKKFKVKASEACNNLESNYNRIVASLATNLTGDQEFRQAIATILENTLKSLRSDSPAQKPKTRRKKKQVNS